MTKRRETFGLFDPTFQFLLFKSYFLTETNPPNTSLFVRGLQETITTEKLREAFGGYGTLVDVRLIYDTGTNKPKG